MAAKGREQQWKNLASMVGENPNGIGKELDAMLALLRIADEDLTELAKELESEDDDDDGESQFESLVTNIRLLTGFVEDLVVIVAADFYGRDHKAKKKKAESN